MAGSFTTVRVTPVLPIWEERFIGAPLSSAWILRQPAVGASAYNFDPDGSLVLDAPDNGDCTYNLQNCLILTRPFPTGIAGLTPAGSWALETYVSFDMFSSRSPELDNMIGFGIFDTAKSLPGRTVASTGGAFELMIDMKRFTARNQAGFESLNAPWPNFTFNYKDVSSTQPNTPIGSSPWAWLRLERNAVSNTWRIGIKYFVLNVWNYYGPFTDAQLFRSTNDTPNPATFKFQPATAQIALYARSRSAKRALGRVGYVRWIALDCDQPGPSVFSTSSIENATIAGLQPLGSYRYKLESGGPFGYGPPTAVLGPFTPVSGASTLGWNASLLVEVARGKPAAMISNSNPGYGVDGLFTTEFATGQHTVGSWWRVDLGINTAVKEVVIYGSPTLYSSLNGVVVQVGPTTDNKLAVQCDDLQTPKVFDATTVYNGQLGARRFNCTWPIGVAGRYLFVITGRPDTVLRAREVQVYASNRCPARTSSGGVQTPGTVCADGSPYGSVCTHKCAVNQVIASGSETSTCNGDRWNDPPLACVAQCPPLPAPNAAASCSQSVVFDGFNSPWNNNNLAWVGMEESMPGLGQTAFGVSNAMQIRARAGCGGGATVLHTNPKLATWVEGFTITTRMQTDDRAGITFHVQDIGNWYRFVMDVRTGLHYVERSLGGFVQIITDGYLNVKADVWYDVKLVMNDQGYGKVYVQDLPLLEFKDMSILSGRAGFYAATYGLFEWFLFNVDCGETCTNVPASQSCTFTCNPGLKAVNPSNGAFTCQSSGAWSPLPIAGGGNFDMECTLDPPVMAAATLTVNENAARNAIVGDPIVAVITSSEYQIVFSISGDNTGGLFFIDACSGQVKVRKGGAANLDYERQSTFLVNVTASVVGFSSSSTTKTMTINLINIDEAPSVTGMTFNLTENSEAGDTVGQLLYSDPENDAVLFALEVDGSSGLFRVSPSGLITLNGTGSGLNYEAVPAPYSMVVRVTQTNAAALTSSGTVYVRLRDANDAPTVIAGQALGLIETFVAGCSVPPCLTPMNVLAVDEDGALSPFFGNPAFVLVLAANMASVPGCAGAWLQAPYSFPTSTKLSTGADLFAIQPVSGDIILAARPTAVYEPFSFGGDVVRAVYTVCVNVTDPFGAWNAQPVAVKLLAGAVVIPVVDAMSTPASGMIPTLAGVPIVFTGTDFGPLGKGSSPAAFMVHPLTKRLLNMTNCTVTLLNTEITCTLPTGSGAGYLVTVQLNLGGTGIKDVLLRSPLIVSFNMPVVTNVLVNSLAIAPVATDTTGNLQFLGLDLSEVAALDAVTVFYGPSFTDLKYPCPLLTSPAPHTNIKCKLSFGAGANLVWRVSVGGQVVDSPADNSLNIAYTRPVVTGLDSYQGSSLTSLMSSGGQQVYVNGTNFGPVGVALTATYGDLAFTLCKHVTGNEHKTLLCTVAPGVGKDRAIVVTVEGQANLIPYTGPSMGLSYAVPIVHTISGAGVVSAETEGGQLIVITGKHFGPIGYVNDNALAKVAYGREAPNSLYTASGCRVTSDPAGADDSGRIECLSSPGIGRGHALLLTVGGQVIASAFNTTTIGYAAPSVYSFSGAGTVNTPADTVGSESTTITGKGFGPNDAYTNARIIVSYGVALEKGPVATVLFTPASCMLQALGHSSMVCTTAEGAGRALAWTVVVDGTKSVQPTTMYATPVIDSVELRDGSNTVVPYANVDGGTVAVLTGRFFGPTTYNVTRSLVQSVTYGPSGSEFTLETSAWSHTVAHTEIRVTLPPGAGDSMRFSVGVADQVAQASAVTFSYAPPTIVLMDPATASTYSSKAYPTIITLYTMNLPLLDTRVRVNIRFGNGASAIDIGPIVPIGAAAIAKARQADGTVAIKFELPENGGGVELGVQLQVLQNAGTSLPIAVSAVDANSLFNYNPPTISSVAVTRARFKNENTTENDGDAVDCPFAEGDARWRCTDTKLVQLSIYGDSFGQGQLSPSDEISQSSFGVDKLLQIILYNDTFGLVWAPKDVKLKLFSWTHDTIIAFTPSSTDTLRMALTSKAYDGRTVVQELIKEYSPQNPEVSNIDGEYWDIPTTGHDPLNPDGYITVTILNMGLTSDIEVSVMVQDYVTRGESAPVKCTIILDKFDPYGASGSWPTTKAMVADMISQTPADSGIQVRVRLPPGQGYWAPVIVTRIDGTTRTDSNQGWSVYYSSPDITLIEIFSATDVLVRSVPCDGSWSSTLKSIVSVPTDGSYKLKIYGTNLGVSPMVTLGDKVESYGPTAVVSCDGGTALAPKHTCYKVQTPPGEGTGSQYLNTGDWNLDWRGTFVLGFEAGEYNTYTGYNTEPIRFIYDPAEVDEVRNDKGGLTMSTRGNAVITLNGKNFGVQNDFRPTTEILVEFFRADNPTDVLVCADPVRFSHFTLNCTLPEGSGSEMNVRVTVALNADKLGSVRKFSYSKPVVHTAALVESRVWFTARAQLQRDDEAALALVLGADTTPDAQIAAAVAGVPIALAPINATVFGAPGTSLPLLRPSTDGGSLLVLIGENFGSRNNISHCAFLSWAFRRVDPLRVAACNNREDFLGEGEVSFMRVVMWEHGRIVLAIPPGLGSKDVELSVRGNGFAGGRTDAVKVRIRYGTPTVTSMVPKLALEGNLVSTEGNQEATVSGTNFGPASSASGNMTLDSERFTDVVVSLEDAAALPTAYVAVVFHRSCASSARNLYGFRATAPLTTWYGTTTLDACDSRVTVVANRFGPGSSSTAGRSLAIYTQPGVGIKKVVQVIVVEDASAFIEALPFFEGSAQSASAVLEFSYAPPTLSSFKPNPLSLKPKETETALVDIRGANFGNGELAVAQGWTLGEQALDGKIGGFSCDVLTRRRQAFGTKTETVITCELAAASLTAGLRNATLRVAGQLGSVDVSEGVEIVCAYNYYGRINETCLPCPADSEDPMQKGADCYGYLEKVAIYENRFSYPRPRKGWYNLNSSDMYTRRVEGRPSMMDACPGGFQDAGRDVCIVPCDPQDSCLGDNLCAEGYTSKSPMWRCSSCDKGFYKRSNECIKCPDSPAALFIGFILLVIVVATVGFFLNKKQINIAVISIGVDFFQVLAIFAQARIKWPPIVKELLHVLSAFNLNIEIVAPECLIPDVSYKQKFWFIMLLPLCIAGLLGASYVSLGLYKMFVLGQPKKRVWDHHPALVSSTLVLLYLLYLYLTRTIFDVFNCGPTFPPDGKQYLQVVFEECGVKGGTQLTLMGYAIAGLVVYTVGYPTFLGYTIWKNREIVMEDQLLRAKGMGGDKLTNPRAFDFRATFGRSYFQFKPDFIMWILAIIFRKFCIAITSVVFGKNSSFQMAACLLIMFVAYAAQVQLRPYMSAGDFDEVLKSHQDASFNSAIHARLRASLAGIETRGRKKGHKNLINFEGKVDRNAVLGVLTGFFFNYNTVEAIMQFCAVIVCLMAIMYQANELSSYYPQSKDSVTAVLMIIIIWAILYFFTVFITEVVVLYNEDNRSKQLAKASGRKGKGKEEESGSSSRKGRLVDEMGSIQVGNVESATNPMFLRNDNSGAGHTGAGTSMVESIMAQQDAPPVELWRVFQQSFADANGQVRGLTEQLAELRKELSLARSGASDGPESSASSSGARTKREFNPSSTGAAEAGFNSMQRGSGKASAFSMAGARKALRAQPTSA